MKTSSQDQLKIDEVKSHSWDWISIVTSVALLAGAVGLRAIVPAELSIAPLPALACIFPTLIFNRLWGTMAALTCSVTGSIFGIYSYVEPFHAGVFWWNLTINFLFLEILVLVVDRIPRKT
jgi:hypothetical protein